MVKYIISLVIVVFLTITSGAAQQKHTPEWNFGVGFGPTFSTLSMVYNNTNNTVDTKNIQHYLFGVSARYVSEKNLGIIGELNYSQQGWEEKFEEGSTSKDIHRLNYLELPILTHIYFGNKVRFFVNLGPKFSFLLSESEDMENIDFINGSTDSNGDIVNNQYGKTVQRKFDYALMVGGGLEFRSKIGNFSLEGRYTLGLGDIYSSKKEDTFSRSANRVISVKLTYYVKVF